MFGEQRTVMKINLHSYHVGFTTTHTLGVVACTCNLAHHDQSPVDETKSNEF